MNGIYVNKNKKNIYIPYTDCCESTRLEDVRIKNAAIRSRQIQDTKDRIEYKETHKYGYCPHCGMLIPLNGKCDCQ